MPSLGRGRGRGRGDGTNQFLVGGNWELCKNKRKKKRFFPSKKGLAVFLENHKK